MPRTSWADFGQILSFMNRMKGKEEDPLERARSLAGLESTALDISRKRRELAGPAPREKYLEEQRSEQVGSALEMFGSLYKTASPASRKILGEQIGSLWGIMSPADKTKYKMLVSHTPINPDVQKAMWFEETNPRPTMDAIIRYQMPSSAPYGQPTPEITNLLERKPENRRMWAEYDIASDEWATLRQMAVSGKTAKEAGLEGIPRQYQTDDSNVTAERNPLTKRIEFTDWREVKATHAEIQVAIDKNWATWEDIKRGKQVPLSAPREYSLNSRPVTVTQVRDIGTGDVGLNYEQAGPIDESEMKPPKALTDAISLVDSEISLEKVKMKSPDVVGYYTQLENIIDTSGKEREWLLRDLQQSIAARYPSEERYIPFVPEAMNEGRWFRLRRWLDEKHFVGYFMPTPSAGKKGNVLLVQADRLVDFYDKSGIGMKFWWSDIHKVAYDTEGIPIKELFNRVPGDTVTYTWEELEKLRGGGK